MFKELEFLLSPISKLKGFGEKSIAIYKKLLISKRFLEENKEPKILDLIYHKPERIQYRKLNPDLLSVQDGELITIKVFVDKYEKPTKHNQPHRIRCLAKNSFITVVYFKTFPDFISKFFREGSEIVISGKVERFNNELQMTHPDYVNNYITYSNIPTFEKIYPLTAGLSNRVLSKSIQNVLKTIPDLPEWLDEKFLLQHNWKSWKESILSIHNSEKEEDLSSNSPYIERLSFDEILANQIALGMMREKIKTNNKKNELINKNNNLKKFFLSKLPFELTGDQKKVIQEIEDDIYSKKRMLRLLQGDVGSGKTVVSFLTMLPFLENQKQVALMVPTSILATQHYEWITKMCDKYNIEFQDCNDIQEKNIDVEYKKELEIKITKNKKVLMHESEVIESNGEIILNQENQNKRKIRVALLTGKIKGKKREKILNELKNGEIDILIGTHAIFQEKVEFKNLSYAVIDEQHRFGVSQRLNLIEKGDNIDILIMTATPIPRTLALTIYGDMEVSVIKEKPKNRKEIITSCLQKEKFNELIYRIKEKIKQEEKIYWICPLIEESENLPATPLFQRYEEFKNFFDKDEIGFIHGKLTEDEKDKIMEEFGKKDGKVKILIATTVIEVGIDVPDATIIVIESPERFGLSQIHQLRGRVGRGDKQSYCILFYEKLTQNLKKRMDILKNNSNGFLIAEEDLKLRGSGEILGVKQSGYQEYLIANLSENYNLLLEASKLARYIVNNKNLLESREIKILLEMFGYGELLNEAILN